MNNHSPILLEVDPAQIDNMAPSEDVVHRLQRQAPAPLKSEKRAARKTDIEPMTNRVCETLDILQMVEALECQNGGLRRVDKERNSLEVQNKSCRVMIVDDEEANVMTVRQHLVRAGYENFIVSTDARQAMYLATSELPDLILLDIKMPHVNGLEILRAMSIDSNLRNIPVVILTAASDPKIKAAALEMGANDFLTKPVDPVELIPRVRNALMIKSHFDQFGKQKAQLEETVRRRTLELYQSRQQIILSLARAAEHRDNETGNHVLRVGCYASIIARQLGWQTEAIEMIQQAAQLHDVGKIGVPDSILFKPGKLDQHEYEIMQRHCSLGKIIISPFDNRESELVRSHARLGESILNVKNSPLMMMAARIAQTHHEHWNGNGYPLGLAGSDIPVEGRITAVADVYDALSSKRPYKDAFPRQKCFDIMADLREKQFDPDVLDAFFACSAEIIEVQLSFMDE